jgi:bifunctional UDP-N-acetylglucosamine pyrophosphorylase/glucosamine-1-phosphate N-acetyltransferase
VSNPDISFSTIVLAAGRGVRMRSSLRNVLHPVAGVPMLRRVVNACREAGAAEVVVVLPPDDGGFAEALEGVRVQRAVQTQARGTGDAANVGAAAIQEPGQAVFVLPGDVPAIEASAIRALIEAHLESGAALTVATMELPDPARYGRIVRAADGGLEKIVEWKEASAEERALREVNTGLLVFEPGLLLGARAGGSDPGLLHQLEPAPGSGELYLTDGLQLSRERGLACAAWAVPEAVSFTGVNTREALAFAEGLLRSRAIRKAYEEGVAIERPDTVVLDPETELARDVRIEVGVQLRGRNRIGEGVILRAGSVLSDVDLGAGCEVGPYSVLQDVRARDAVRVGPHCHLKAVDLAEGARVLAGTVADGVDPKAGEARGEDRVRIGPGSVVGPMSHLRVRTELGAGSKVGNFVEIKASELGAGSKASHLAYVGDAEVGKDVNIGAGVITCNYDGVAKHKTVIHDGAFVGSDSQLVAPVTVGEGAYVGSGSTVTTDVPAGALAVSRSRQRNLKGYAERLRRRARSRGTGTGEKDGS